MAAIGHGRSIEGDLQTTNASFTTVATISDASLKINNAKFLLIVKAGLHNAGANDTGGMQVVHGSTVFPTSVMDTIECNGTSQAGGTWSYVFMTVFTQPATAEDVLVQLVNHSTTTTFARETEVYWIRLDADLTEDTDWFFVEDTGDVNHTTSPVTQSTLTQSFAAGNWLILSGYHIQIDSTAINYEVILDSSGGGLTASTEPNVIQEGEDTNDQIVGMIARVFNLDGTSATFNLQTQDIGSGANDWIGSSIFALNLEKFDDHFTFENMGDVATSTSFVEIGNAEPVVSVTGDWFIGAFCTCDINNVNRRFAMQIQESGADITEPGVDLLFYRGHDSIDEVQGNAFALVSLTAGTQDIDFDADASGTGGEYEDRSLYGFSMELAGPPAPTIDVPYQITAPLIPAEGPA